MSLGDPRGWGRGPSLLFLPFPPRSAEEHRLATTGGSFIPPFRTPLRRGGWKKTLQCMMGNPAFLPQSQGPGSPASALNPVQTLMDTKLRVSSALTLLIHFFLLKTGVWGLWECPIPPPPPGYFAPPTTTTHTPPGPGPVLTFRVPGLTLGVLRPPPGLGPRPGSTVSPARVLGRSCSATWWLC